MAREVLVGIVIKARDGASEILRKIGNAGRKIGNDLDEGKEKGKKALEVFERSVNAINSTMEIAKKATEMLRAGFEATVGAALAQRAETDAQRQSFEAFGTQIQRIQGLIGDVLLPVILGIGDAFKPALTAAEKWLSTNKQIVGGGIIEFLRDTAQILVSGVATGVLLVTRAWSGWKQLIAVVKSGFASLFQVVLDWYSMVLGGYAKIASAFGADGIAAGVQQAADALKSMATASGDTADQALADAAREAKAQEDLEKKIDATAAAISQGIGTAATAAYARLGQETKKVPPDIDKITAAAEAAAAKLQAFRDRVAAAASAGASAFLREQTQKYERLADLTEKEAKTQQGIEDERIQEARAQAAATVGYWANAGMQVRDVMVSAFSDIDGKQKTVVDGLKQMFLGLTNLVAQKAQEYAIAKAIEMAADKAAATAAIEASASQAAAGQVAAYSSIPFVGIALGVAAAATIFGIIMSYVGKFHTGGVVPGRPGEEKLAILQAGEVIVPRDRAGAALAAGFGPMGSSGASARGSSGGGGHLGVTVRSLLPSTVEIERTERNKLSRSRARNMRLGAQGV